MTRVPASCMIERVMDKKYEEALLFDFYGELLTEKQKTLYEEARLNDYSFGEIALERGVSRQSIHDTVRRTAHILEEYERRLGLVRRFLAVKKKTEEIRRLTDDPVISKLADEILEEL